MYRIGLFSKINKITVKTLRYYDEAELLKPAYVDSENNYRYYTSEQLPKLHKIIALRQIGFSIEQISEILDDRNIEEMFKKRKKTLEKEVDERKRQLSQISHYIRKFEEDYSMNYEIALKELPEVIVYSKRMKIPNYDHYFKIIPQIGEEVSKANPDLKCAVPEYCFVIYHDGEYKERDIDVEFCEAVTEFGKDTDTIKFKKIKRVPTAACVFHKGPYSTIGNAYGEVFKWINDNGYIPIDNPRESYIDGIWNKENDNEWLTEIQVPVIKSKI